MVKKPKFCPECGTKVIEDAKFCMECGDKLYVRAEVDGPEKEANKTDKDGINLLYFFVGMAIILFNLLLLILGLWRHDGVIDLRHMIEFIILLGFGVWVTSKAWRKNNSTAGDL